MIRKQQIIACKSQLNYLLCFDLLESGDMPYSKEIFDALVMRYEAPDSRNRWDSPLITVQVDDDLPKERLASALFDRKPPPPNQSTQNVRCF